MALYDSIEVRWFGPLSRSDEPALRVHLVNLLGAPEDRPDDYIVVSTADDFGIKVRGAGPRSSIPKLEFKGRTHVLGDHVLPGGLKGRVERWTKWSYEGNEVLRLAEPAEKRQVAKSRFQRLCAYDAADNLLPPPEPGARIVRGAAAEVTILSVGSENFWTLGFEAFPGGSWSLSSFDIAVGNAKDIVDGIAQWIPTLDEEMSCSYPAWLSRSTSDVR